MKTIAIFVGLKLSEIVAALALLSIGNLICEFLHKFSRAFPHGGFDDSFLFLLIGIIGLTIIPFSIMAILGIIWVIMKNWEVAKELSKKELI
jgi:hypothetical protein